MEQIFTHLAALNSMYLLSQSSPGSDVQAQLGRVLCPGFCKASIKVSAGAGIFFQAHWLLEKFIPLKP